MSDGKFPTSDAAITMTVKIPSALDPEGNPVPIEEAERFKNNYYRCPECREILNPRKGEKRTHFFAHKKGVLDETDCPLGTKSGVDSLVEEYRQSETEASEQQKRIEVFLTEFEGSHLELLGKLPTVDWDKFGRRDNVDDVLGSFSFSTTGTRETPVALDFHPQHSEVLVELDPDADQYRIDIECEDRFSQLQGTWTAEPLDTDDVFVGDQDRAKRIGSHQYRTGEWVYAIEATTPPHLSEHALAYTLGSFSVIRFQLNEETEPLLERYVDETTTTEHGFDADILLPADATPTTEAPIKAHPASRAVVSIEPSSEIDPVFEVVPVPKKDGDPAEIEPTGAGNPRFCSLGFPEEGSRRVTIHQRGTKRHRLIQLEADREQVTATPVPFDEERGRIGILVSDEDTDLLLDPIRGPTSVTLNRDRQPGVLADALAYQGPEGFAVDVSAQFPADANIGPVVTRNDRPFEEIRGELPHWLINDCGRIKVQFETLGAIQLQFASPDAVDRDESKIVLHSGDQQ